MTAETRTIVVAVDGSPAADEAVATGVEIAEAVGGTVLFVHAATPAAEDLFEAFPDKAPPPDEILARDPVLARATASADARGIASEAQVIAVDGGSAVLAADIAGLASGSDAFMIVTGSRGRGAVAGAVLGSVSQNLIRHATVPVLVVHAPDERADRYSAGRRSKTTSTISSS